MTLSSTGTASKSLWSMTSSRQYGRASGDMKSLHLVPEVGTDYPWLHFSQPIPSPCPLLIRRGIVGVDHDSLTALDKRRGIGGGVVLHPDPRLDVVESSALERGFKDTTSARPRAISAVSGVPWISNATLELT